MLVRSMSMSSRLVVGAVSAALAFGALSASPSAADEREETKPPVTDAPSKAEKARLDDSSVKGVDTVDDGVEQRPDGVSAAIAARTLKKACGGRLAEK